jgi:hypothetical protein
MVVAKRMRDDDAIFPCVKHSDAALPISGPPHILRHMQSALVIGGLFICEFAYSQWQKWSQMTIF